MQYQILHFLISFKNMRTSVEYTIVLLQALRFTDWEVLQLMEVDWN